MASFSELKVTNSESTILKLFVDMEVPEKTTALLELP